MPQRSKDGENELPSDVAQAVEEKTLGSLVDTFPLQRRGLFTFKDTRHLVHRFEQGFVDDPAAGAAPLVALRYDQISWVRQAFVKHYVNHYYNRTTYSFGIRSTGGQVIQWKGSYFDSFQGSRFKSDGRLPEFGTELAKIVSQAQLPAHLKALADGKALTFGNVVISQQGVRGPDGVVPWSQLEPLDVDRGVAMVRRTGHRKPMASTYLASIPNLPLFSTLYENLRRPRPT
jgi:hypothetical protein